MMPTNKLLQDHKFRTEDFQLRGIDRDLESCLAYNPQNGFIIEDIKAVLAVIEGEKEGKAWHWVCALKDRRFVYLTGESDYSGWDCVSSATSHICKTKWEACSKSQGDKDIFYLLRAQLVEKKKIQTWKEEKNKEFQV